MDYLELSGATISERDKAFAQEFANFVNGSMCSPDQIGRELTRAHRYLQQQMFKVFLGFMNFQPLNDRTMDEYDFPEYGRQCELITPWRGYHRGTIVALSEHGFVVQFSSGAEIDVYKDEIILD